MEDIETQGIRTFLVRKNYINKEGENRAKHTSANGLLDTFDTPRIDATTPVRKMEPMETSPTLPFHCTMKYAANQSDMDYKECWNEIMNRQQFHLMVEDIYVGPQWAAAAVKLPDYIVGWFQVRDSQPHMIDD